MRLRDQSLRTGSLLAWFDAATRANNRSLLFLVSGASDIEPLTAIESSCRQHIAARGYTGFEWHAVPDQGQLSAVDPELDVSRVQRFEACEFADLSAELRRELLGAVINRMAVNEAELLPTAGGAVGAPAEGINFLDRANELQELASLIRQRRSVFLQAPRRAGKTSLMRRIQTELAAEFATVPVNLERDPTLEELAARLRTFATGEGYRAALRFVQRDPQASLGESLSLIAEGGAGKPLLLLLDEFVRLVDELRRASPRGVSVSEQVHSFFAALEASLEPLDVRMVVAGSVDLFDYLAREIGLPRKDLPPLFRDLQTLPLRPLALEVPECEIRRVLLGTGLVVEPQDFRWLEENLDLSLPFPALRFIDQLASAARQRGALRPQDLDVSLRDFLETTDSFNDLEEHLLRKRPDIARATETASEVLDLVAQEPFDQGATTDQVRAILERGVGAHAAKLKEWLLQTFPLKESAGRVRLVSRLFWHWWRCQAEAGGRRHD
jgi:AAA+ ATPase superfamily predicted ATPase